MLGILRIFFGTAGVNRFAVLSCLLLAGLAEGVGLATLMPLLNMIAGGGAEPANPLDAAILGTLRSVGLDPGVGLLVGIVVAGVSLKAALGILAMNYVGYAVAEVSTRLRSRLIDGLLRVRWSYFNRQPLGRIANAVSQEATRSGEAYLSSAQLIALMVQTSIYVLLAFLISWRLALVAMAVGGGITLVLHRFVRITRRAGRRQTKRTSELVTQLSDALIGIKPLKAMARHAQVSAFLEGKIGELRKALRRQVVSKQLTKHLQEPLLAICLGIGIYFASVRWGMPIPELLVTGLLLERTVTTVGKVQQQLQKAASIESAYWAIHRMIADTEAEREPLPGSRLPSLREGCAFKGVSFAFGEKPVLDDLSIEMPAGQLTVITGASGAGKTTLTDLLLGLYLPDRGEVLIDGVPLAEIDLQRWRSMVGYVPQELILFHDTVLANITLGDPTISEERAEAALRAAGAWGFVSSLPRGLHTIVGERGTRLSGGQRQRVALARALVHDPRLLILDEVTSALDPETEAEICRNIRELAGALTIVAITHRPAWLEAADRVYHLSGAGAVVAMPGTSRVQALPS